MPQLRDDLFGFVTPSRHEQNPLCCHKTYFKVDQFGGGGSAYVTGNVASNLIGRMLSSGLADSFGLSFNFYAFAALNLGDAALAFFAMRREHLPTPNASGASAEGVAALLRKPLLVRTFAIGFCILFAFIGVFTFVNFVLVRPPLSIGQMSIGFVYLVFLPSIFTTPIVGGAVVWMGARRTMAAALGVAGVGLPLLVTPWLPAILAGLALVAVGTFAAQAAATGFVSRNASVNRTAASGLYLSSYFCGGLAGTAVLGQLFDAFGWGATVAGVGVALIFALILALSLDGSLKPVRASGQADGLALPCEETCRMKALQLRFAPREYAIGGLGSVVNTAKAARTCRLQ